MNGQNGLAQFTVSCEIMTDTLFGVTFAPFESAFVQFLKVNQCLFSWRKEINASLMTVPIMFRLINYMWLS